MNIKEKMLNIVFGVISLVSLVVIFLSALLGLAGLAFGFGRIDPGAILVVFWVGVVVWASSFKALLDLKNESI